VRTYFLEAHPVSLAKNLLTIGFDPEFAEHRSLVDNSKNHLLLQTKLKEMGHPQVQVKFVVAPAPVNQTPEAGIKNGPTPQVPVADAPALAASLPPAVSAAVEPNLVKSPPAKVEPPKPTPKPVSTGKPDFKNDLLIQKALEVFKGQIVEVRS
jgi:hypothetical protein